MISGQTMPKHIGTDLKMPKVNQSLDRRGHDVEDDQPTRMQMMTGHELPLKPIIRRSSLPIEEPSNTLQKKDESKVISKDDTFTIEMNDAGNGVVENKKPPLQLPVDCMYGTMFDEVNATSMNAISGFQLPLKMPNVNQSMDRRGYDDEDEQVLEMPNMR